MLEGGKARALAKLQQGGFSVPPFFVCDAAWSEKKVLAAIKRELPGVRYFAVRSSAAQEDSKKRSFAGHFYSGLAVPRESVSAEILKVNTSFGEMRGAVIVQEFVPSDTAGVMFTEVAGNTVVINATIGLCQSVVGGESCDEYQCNKDGVVQKRTISEGKTIKLFSGGRIATGKSDKESIDGAQIKRLVLIGAKIQHFFGSPQDVEWCFRNGELFILQARPITRDFGFNKEEYFDSANIAESYSGTVLPLTCSFARMVYALIYKDLLQMSGVSRRKIERHSRIFENLLGFFYGRMYYNMNNWYALAEFVPGYRRNKANFELMITSNIKQDVTTSIRPSLALRILYPLIVGVKVAAFGFTARRFKSGVHNGLRRLQSLDFGHMGYTECINLFEDINKSLLRRWYITLENDFFVMTYLGVLKKSLGEDALQKAIIFPSKATEQVSALVSLSKHMKEISPLWRTILSDDVHAFKTELPRHDMLDRALQDYLHTFGGRFASELKLESVGIDEDTTKLFAALRAYQNYNPKLHNSQNVLPLPFIKRIIVQALLRKFKKYASRREEFRLLRSNTFAMARRLFRRMGQLLAERGSIECADDVFYLHMEEILEPALKHQHLAETVKERKREYASYKNISPPAHFSTTNGALPLVDTLTKLGNSIPQARPASPGLVKGRVRVFKEFSLPPKIDFDILVTSHTDPGWTSLIALSKGLIIEHGGVLSHASIVARELGIPAVIGAKDAVSILRDGQIVEIDGSAGTIKIL